jgi:trehalose 6-phosphate phosphatase
VGASLNGAMALVSGRSISELDRLFAPRRWPAAGIHGLERRDAAGAVHRAVEDDPQLEIARHELGRLTQRLPGTILEDKGLTLAVHYRRAPQCEEELRTAVLALARRCGSGFDVLEGRKVLELRPVGATKAHAIREFLAEPPFLGRRPIFLGDDITDASGLDEVERRGGLSVAVGDRVRGMVRVDGPREVRIFLAGLARNGSPPT